MRSSGDKARAIALRWQKRFRPMHAIRANVPRELRVSRDQQDQRARAANVGKLARDTLAVFAAKVAVDHGRASRQGSRYRDRIGRALGIGQEKQRWRAWFARLAVEAAGKRG